MPVLALAFSIDFEGLFYFLSVKLRGYSLISSSFFFNFGCLVLS
jgi:hypothetical protein